ncbi:hypothetical protein LBMAG53_24120 [Planctomycetota bacterium]|nr:hypothetical protein LBMAG53_24120 [Planctomycetota bacterium]
MIAAPATDPVVIAATAFGVRGDAPGDQRAALQAALDAAIAAGHARLELPPGRIRIEAPAALGAWLQAAITGSLVIAGADGGTTLVRCWHGAFDDHGLPPFLALSGPGCAALRDLRIDADPWFHALGVVESSDPIRVRLVPGSPRAPRMVARQVAITTPDGTLVAGKIDWAMCAEAVQDPADPGVMILGGDRLDRTPAPGQMLAWFFAFDGGSCLACHHLAALEMTDVAMPSSNGFAVSIGSTGATTLRRLDFAPAPGRCVSHPRDLVHGTGITGPVLIEDCRFAGSSDDGINVHSFYLQVAERRGARTCLMRPIHLGNRYSRHRTGWPLDLSPGDVLDLLDADRQPAFSTRIASCSVAGHANLVTVTDDLPDWVGPGTWIDPRSTLPPSTVIRRCAFRAITSRGIKCSVHDCLIEDCTFTNITSPGLHLTGEFDWEESASPCRVTVRGCRFDGCDFQDLHGYFRRAALLIQPKEIPGAARVCRDIRIEDCTFTAPVHAAIDLHHATGVVITGCGFSRAATTAVTWDPATSDPPALR